MRTARKQIITISKVFVKDRIPYALLNVQEIIIMKMRARAECRVKREVKEDYTETTLDHFRPHWTSLKT